MPKHLIDPALLPGLEFFPELNLSAESLPPARAQIDGFMTAMRAMEHPGVRVEEHRVPHAGQPDVRVVAYTKTDGAARKPAYLYIHGGGYVFGAADMGAIQNAAYASDFDCVVVAVDYRLAPETPHPGPVEDCYAALQWLHDSADKLGVDPQRIVVGGDSAGGGLAAALCLMARDRGKLWIAFQLLNYPMLDDRSAVHADPHPYTGHYAWKRSDNHFGWSALLGQEPGSAGISPYAAAARAENLAGLPPTLITVGALDLFLEEDLEYARRLTRAGVPTELHVVPGAFHGFDSVNPAAPVVLRYREYIRGGLQRALAAEPSPS